MASSCFNLHFLIPLLCSCFYSNRVIAIELPIGLPAVSFQFGGKLNEQTYYYVPGSSIHKEIIQKCIDEKILSSPIDCVQYGDVLSYHVYGTVYVSLKFRSIIMMEMSRKIF